MAEEVITTKHSVSEARVSALTSEHEDGAAYVRAVLDDLGVRLRPDGRVTSTAASGGDQEEDLPTVTAQLRAEYRKDSTWLSKNLGKREKKNLAKLTSQAIADGLALCMAAARRQHEEDLRKHVEYDGSTRAHELMAQFLTAMRDEPAQAVHVGAMLHWMACVKRNMLGLPVVWHLLPVFVGPNGMGKSVALARLLSPIEDDVLSMNDVSAATEEQGRVSMARALVVRFDEMARVDKADLAKLKGLITGTKVTSRVLYTNVHATATTRTSFIGTANFDVSTMVPDPSGMRRWIQINCDKRSRYDEINSFDALALWRAVDPNADYRSPISVELEALQEEMRTKSPVEFFLEYMGLRPADGGGTERILYEQVYEEYCEWSKSTGEKELSLRTVMNALRQLRMDIIKSNGRTYILTALPRVTPAGLTSRAVHADRRRTMSLLEGGKG